MKKNENGFTLVELLAVIAILAILATISIVAVNGILRNSNTKTKEVQEELIKSAAKAYAADNLANCGGGCFVTYSQLMDGGYIDEIRDENKNIITGSVAISKIGNKYKVAIGQNYIDSDYSGTMRQIALEPGTYKLEVWGAQGGANNWVNKNARGGHGAYATGTITLTGKTTIYVYVGGQGTGLTENAINTGGGWNGGGNATSLTTSWGRSGGGGGGTDIRIGGTTNNHRVIVAGGGGGGGTESSTAFTTTNYWTTYSSGGAETGLSGSHYCGTTRPSGGGQSTGGTAGIPGNAEAGSFGQGGNAATTNNNNYNSGSGGGGGWFGGGGGHNCCGNSGGGGGSSYVLTSTSTRPSGYLHATGSPYNMTNDIKISGNALMPNPSGGTCTFSGSTYSGAGCMSGKTGNGFVKITKQ